MNSIELYAQEKKDFCLCSVLQAVFRKYGIVFSQQYISECLTPGKERGFVVDDKRIKEFMRKNGFEYSCFGAHETPFNEPETLLAEMCNENGIIGIKHHAYLVKKFERDTLTAINPEDKSEIEKEYPALLKEMEKTGFFGLIKYIL
jgi:hypothetical protein